MWESSADILNMVLAISVASVSFVLLFVLFYLILVLRDMSFTTQSVRKITDDVQKYIQTPVKIAMDVYKSISSTLEWVDKKTSKKK
jgi:Na+-transporting methylmalonyl-CoA/oxaloacetate decarboxylase gamma subunit